MKQTTFWHLALTSDLIACRPIVLLLSGSSPLHPVQLIQGVVLLGGPLLILFGILLALHSLLYACTGKLFLRKLIFGTLSFCFLASLGAIGTGVQALIASLIGTDVMKLLLAGAISAVVVGILGLSSRILSRFSAIQLFLLGGGLIITGVFITLVQVILLLYPFPW